MKIVGELRKAHALVPQPGYPKVTATEEGFSVQVRYVCSPAELRYLPRIGEAYTGETGIRHEGDKLVLSELRAEPKADAAGPWTADLTYTPEPLCDEVTGSGRSLVRKTYELHTEDQDVPLAQHPRYRMCWDHVLAARNGGAVPAWWSSATSAADCAEGYQWLRPGDAVPEGWTVLAAETKPGVTAFRSGVVRVSLAKTCLTRKAFDEEARRQDYTIGRPGKTFGVAGRWLRGGSTIRRNGRLWELTVDYINAKAIDTDLYDE